MPIGGGAIVRVGDSATIFAPDITSFMVDTACELSTGHKGFRYQRKLMDGGRCEGSVFSEFGYTTGGLCVALGNYHNRNFENGTTEPEYVSIDDMISAVTLMNGMVERSEKLSGIGRRMRPAYRPERHDLGQLFYIADRKPTKPRRSKRHT